MEVHAGKLHSEIIQCGLCDYKTKDLANLETHLSTCEIYECDRCYFRVTQIGDIKFTWWRNMKVKISKFYMEN